MSKTGLVGFIGPTGANGAPFVSWLAAVAARPDLEELLLASAYLTDRGAQEVILALKARDSSHERVKVTLLVGTKDGFTRKSAIKALRGLKKHNVMATIRLRCPDDENFHVKAAYARIGKAGHLALVGSHNLTGIGLTSEAEFGVELAGTPASQVRRALQHWVVCSRDWSKVKYKERKALPTSWQASEKVRGVPSSSDEGAAEDHPTGPLNAASRPLTEGQWARFKSVTRDFERQFKSLARRVGEYTFEEDSVDECMSGQGYVRGARFIYTEDFPANKPSEKWWDGQRMMVLEVLHHLRAQKGETVLACAVIESFLSDGAIRELAKNSGVNRMRPTPGGMTAFLRGLRELKLKKLADKRRRAAARS